MVLPVRQDDSNGSLLESVTILTMDPQHTAMEKVSMGQWQLRWPYLLKITMLNEKTHDFYGRVQWQTLINFRRVSISESENLGFVNGGVVFLFIDVTNCCTHVTYVYIGMKN